MIDSRDISDLHPALYRAAKELIRRMGLIGYKVLVTSTYRDFEKQNALYAQGRTKPGSIVTNAKGGQSIHNYRLAFDICKNIVGQEYSDAKFFQEAGKIGTQMGLEWGGSWVGFVDTPHFQFTNGLSLSQLQNGRTVPSDVRLPWEGKKEDEEVVDTTKILIDGKEYTVSRILKDGTNFIKLRDFEQAGYVVTYDADKNLPGFTGKE